MKASIINDVMRIRCALHQLNRIEESRRVLKALPISILVEKKMTRLEDKELMALASLEDAWYGTTEKGKYAYSPKEEGE